MKKMVFYLLVLSILSSGSISALSWDDVKDFYNDHTKEIWITVGVTTSVVATIATALVLMRYKKFSFFKSKHVEVGPTNYSREIEPLNDTTVVIPNGEIKAVSGSASDSKPIIYCFFEFNERGMPKPTQTTPDRSKIPLGARYFTTGIAAHEAWMAAFSEYRERSAREFES